MVNARNIVRNDDIKEVLKINKKENDFDNCFYTEGKWLYYCDGYNSPILIRDITLNECYKLLSNIAEYYGVARENFVQFMLEQNKEVDIDNIGENDFNSTEEIEEWWKGKDEFTIFKIFDEYYGISEFIISI